ncbi:MAG TPA: hypothetical protein PLF81_10935 [Candidatus Anammoximicrobium sp.]|nr:hypothetical protein [Candidatus Anammoximicrobium sp.]
MSHGSPDLERRVGVLAIGGAAVGYLAVGGGALGRFVISGAQRSPEAIEFFRRVWQAVQGLGG